MEEDDEYMADIEREAEEEAKKEVRKELIQKKKEEIKKKLIDKSRSRMDKVKDIGSKIGKAFDGDGKTDFNEKLRKML